MTMILTKDELAHKKVIFLLQSSLLKNVMTVKINTVLVAGRNILRIAQFVEILLRW